MIAEPALIIFAQVGPFWRALVPARLLSQKGRNINMGSYIIEPIGIYEWFIDEDLIKYDPFSFVFYGALFFFLKLQHRIENPFREKFTLAIAQGVIVKITHYDNL